MNATVAQAEVSVPECAAGIGAVITSPQSTELIDGVRVSPIAVWPDDRGFFLEVARMETDLTAAFPAASTQISAALSYPGTIKAFHFHRRQTDLWTPVQGMLQVALIDLRGGSPTYARKNTFYIGALRPWRLLIPPGVAHGYKVIGPEAAVLVYLTDRWYDPEDEGRIPYNDRRIQYDWEIQHK